MPAKESPPPGAWGATHDSVATTLDYHKNRGTIVDWYRLGSADRYVVTINYPGSCPAVTFYGLREVQAFIIGLGSALHARTEGSTAP